MLQTQSRLFTPESFTRVTWLVSRLEQELLTLSIKITSKITGFIHRGAKCVVFDLYFFNILILIVRRVSIETASTIKFAQLIFVLLSMCKPH
jgi:hypothetical protein